MQTMTGGHILFFRKVIIMMEKRKRKLTRVDENPVLGMIKKTDKLFYLHFKILKPLILDSDIFFVVTMKEINTFMFLPHGLKNST